MDETEDLWASEHPNVIEAWQAFQNAYENVPDPGITDITTVGAQIEYAGVDVVALAARAVYLKELVNAEILKRDEVVPDSDLLYESYPANLRAELDA